jgi:hypothetical protein
LKCKVIEAAVNEDENNFFPNNSKWNVDSKSLNEKEISENNSKLSEILSMVIN